MLLGNENKNKESPRAYYFRKINPIPEEEENDPDNQWNF